MTNYNRISQTVEHFYQSNLMTSCKTIVLCEETFSKSAVSQKANNYVHQLLNYTSAQQEKTREELCKPITS